MKTVSEKSVILGKNIQAAMAKAEMNASDLADKTGIETTVIEALQKGAEEIAEKLDSTDIIKIASALNVEESDLFKF